MIVIGWLPSKPFFQIITHILDTCFEIFRSTEVSHLDERLYKWYFWTSNTCWKATFVIFRCFTRLSAVRSCLRDLFALRKDFLDA